MSTYYGFFITDAGYKLITKLVSGKTLDLTKIMVGKGSIPEETEPRSITNLFDPVAEGTSTPPVYDGTTVKMTVEYRSDMNGGLQTGFWLREFGIFANDPDDGEVLIYYGTLGDRPQYVCAASDTGIDVRRFPVGIVIGEGLGVTVEYDCDAFMTAENALELIKEQTTTVFNEERDSISQEIDDDISTAKNEINQKIKEDIGTAKTELNQKIENDISTAKAEINKTIAAIHRYYAGTAITGTESEAKAYPESGVESAAVDDLYLNTDTRNFYRCTEAGDAEAAKWAYVGGLMRVIVTDQDTYEAGVTPLDDGTIVLVYEEE